MARTTYVSLLRGVNVSGQRPVDMKALVRLYQALGHSDVTTYIQSGNVVFSHDGSRAPASLARELEEGIARELDVSATVILRSAAELADVVRDNPFLARNADMRTLHVTFLAGAPGPEAMSALSVPSSGQDEFVVRGREVYLHCPDGYGRTKLNNSLWERRLKTPATTRNWNTVTKLLTLASERTA